MTTDLSHAARLTKEPRAFLFVWKDDADIITIVEYVNGSIIFTNHQLRPAARKEWRLLVSVGYTPTDPYTLTHIPARLAQS